MQHITRFTDRHRFLSNFFEVPVDLWGHRWRSTENAYQWKKFEHLRCLDVFLQVPPNVSKRLGRELSPVRPEWDDMRLSVMRELQQAKFRQNPWLAAKLVETGSTHIYEGNTWNDTFWGVRLDDLSVGHNHLGEILMRLRDELRSEGF